MPSTNACPKKTVRAAIHDENVIITRTVTLKTLWEGYADYLKRDIGDEYRLVFWHAEGTRLDTVSTTITGTSKGHTENNNDARATVVRVPVDGNDGGQGLKVELKYML